MSVANNGTAHAAAIAALATLLLTASAQAAPVGLSGAWFRALPAGLPAAGYFTLHNGGGRMIALTGADSPACGMLMLHKSENMGGMEHMVAVDRIDVAPGATVVFAPGGYHLMCMDPKPALRPGARVPATLQFSDGTRLQVWFAVRGAAGN